MQRHETAAAQRLTSSLRRGPERMRYLSASVPQSLYMPSFRGTGVRPVQTSGCDVTRALAVPAKAARAWSCDRSGCPAAPPSAMHWQYFV